jgi:phage major head subunit gpT-like protein
VAGGTWSNVLATNSDLSEAALEQACIDIQSLQNDRGLAISLIPEKLIIPVELEFEAYRILKANGRVGTDLNDPNALKDMGKFRGGVIVNHYLTDEEAWFIRTNAPHGMKYFERRADEFGTDDDFDTENAKFKATARYTFGWTDPRGIFASPGA